MDTLNVINEYVKKIDKLYQQNIATEYTYRQEFVELLRNLLPGCEVHNEEKHQGCGAPDITIRYHDIALSFIETKPIQHKELDKDDPNSDQFARYKRDLNTVLFTNFCDFHLYSNGELIDQIMLVEIKNDRLIPINQNIPRFISIIQRLCEAKPQPINTAIRLAQLMANKAKLLAIEIEDILKNDPKRQGKLWSQLNAFKDVLINTLTEKEFADLYAQTIAYGLFAARIHDKTEDTFTRLEAAQLIPPTNPFLRQFYQYIAGFDIDDNIAWIVDDLVRIFAVTNIKRVLKGYGEKDQRTDPLMHFYEDFLLKYDPSSKRKYGVYYTPQSVVKFIVSAVDDILKQEFHIADGLADTSKTDVPVRKILDNVERNETETLHRVQILDPATGTGTFLAEVVQRIKETQQKGTWASYVDEHLLPRLNGFEIMMAPYTIAHLKLDMLLNWWGDDKLDFEHKERLRIYLTNSLDQSKLTNKHSIAAKIAEEANQANDIKLNTPVMVVFGNPPYNGESKNKSNWIMQLMEDYKKEPEGAKKLNEKNPKWINNDYCKFIRMGQYYIDKNKEGILAYISANSFLDNPTFRGMRWHLLQSFDKIFIVDLHGDSRKKDLADDGSKDENVFSIQAGTSINIFIKTGKKQEGELADVYYTDLRGKRRSKLEYLDNHDYASLNYTKLNILQPSYLFIPQKTEGRKNYENGFKINDLFNVKSVGIVSANDELNFSFTKEEQKQKIEELKTLDEQQWRYKYNRLSDSRDWTYVNAKKDVPKEVESLIIRSAYRPLDERYTCYTGTTKGLYSFPRNDVMRHLLHDNEAIVVSRQCVSNWRYLLAVDKIVNLNLTGTAGRLGSGYVFPLYLYFDNSGITFSELPQRTPNLNENIWRRIENYCQYGQAYKPLTADEQNGQLGFDAEPEQPHALTPEQIFDYVYGFLHSPSYRERYNEFLKEDFPRVPYPENQTEFDHMVNFGKQLKELHLMRNLPKTEDIPYARFNIHMQDGGKVERLHYENGNVWINKQQYFENVPPIAWEFFIGGYQPAQKWLNERMATESHPNRRLSNDDFKHYARIIYVLMETDRLMKEIDSGVPQ